VVLSVEGEDEEGEEEESREKPELQRHAHEPELVKTLCVGLELAVQVAHCVLLCLVHTALCSWPTPQIEHTSQRESRTVVHVLKYAPTSQVRLVQAIQPHAVAESSRCTPSALYLPALQVWHS